LSIGKKDQEAVSRDVLTHLSKEEVCGECKPKDYPPWENLIKRNNKQTPSFV